MTSSQFSFISWHCWRICLLKMRNIPHINPAPVVFCNNIFWLFQIFIHVLTDQYQYRDYVFAVEIVFKRSLVLQVLKSNQWWKHKHIFNWSTAGLMLGHRLRRRPDIKPGSTSRTPIYLRDLGSRSKSSTSLNYYYFLVILTSTDIRVFWQIRHVINIITISWYHEYCISSDES